MRDLLTNPAWTGDELGCPLPDSPHAVSVALPRWQDVVAYEEHDPACREALRGGYPRFVRVPLIEQLANAIGAEHGVSAQQVWPWASTAAAEAALTFSQQHGADGRVVTHSPHLASVLLESTDSKPLKQFWQHSGLGVSSRRAAIYLDLEPEPNACGSDDAADEIRIRLAHIYDCEADLLGLHPSGMAALYATLRAVSRLRPDRPIVQVGFPYVDVLKQPQVLWHGAELLTDPSQTAVAAALDRLEPAAMIVELPSNPMLRCVDLPALARLAHSRGIMVIADDTIGSPINIDALRHADVVFGSLTKTVAGSGDVLAGSTVVSPGSAWRHPLHAAIGDSIAVLDPADRVALAKSSRDVIARVRQQDATALALTAWLRQQPEIAQVWHPSDCADFDRIRRPNGGYGCLVSFQLGAGPHAAARFYDALAISKGPSLGTTFSLACPYVLLAHFDELEWAAGCGVPADLIRLSVGLEDAEDLTRRLRAALDV